MSECTLHVALSLLSQQQRISMVEKWLILHTHTFISLFLFSMITPFALVSCPDPTLSRGKGSGDHWAISWLCRVSSHDTEQPNEIALRHATMCSTLESKMSRSVYVPRLQKSFISPKVNKAIEESVKTLGYQQPRATQVTWLMAFWEGGVWAQDYICIGRVYARGMVMQMVSYVLLQSSY